MEHQDQTDTGILLDMLRGEALDGACYELAFALSRGTGWPMVRLNADGHPVRHVGVQAPGGLILDARGQNTPEMFAAYFGGTPADLHPVTEVEILAVRPVSETVSSTCGRLAQAVWPELPWKDGSLQERAQAFARDLEALSQRHGLWIRSPYPTAKPMLADHRGDEDALGYSVSPVAGGTSFSIDRTFERPAAKPKALVP